MQIFLTPPTVSDFQNARLDLAAISKAQSVINALHDLARAASPLTVIGLAQSLHPETTSIEAVNLLLIDVEQAVAATKRNADEFKFVEIAERARLAPAKSTASRRIFDIQHRLNAIASATASLKNSTEKRREELLLAKVSPADIDKLEPLFDPAAGAAETAILKTELTALEAFLASSDESQLPDGFEVSELLKVSQPHLPLGNY